MAKQFPALEPDHIAFVRDQEMFFVATAAPEGRVNVSPKGMDSLRVLDTGRIAWLNLTGSGNETAGHLLQSNRMTLMWCSFGKRPLILRAYGRASVVHEGDLGWEAALAPFPPLPGARQVYEMAIDLVQTSCGFAVPFFEHTGTRDTLTQWAESKGPDGVRAYQADRNTRTLDGAPTK